MSTHNALPTNNPPPETPAANAVALVGHWLAWIPLYILFAITVVAGGIAILAVLPFSAAKNSRRVKTANRTKDRLKRRPQNEKLAVQDSAN